MQRTGTPRSLTSRGTHSSGRSLTTPRDSNSSDDSMCRPPVTACPGQSSCPRRDPSFVRGPSSGARSRSSSAATSSVAGAHVDHAIAHTTDRRHWADRSLAEAYRAGVLTLRGQLSEAESCAQVALRLFAWAGYEPTLRIALTQLICIRALRGEDQAIVTTQEREAPDGWRPPSWVPALTARTLGHAPAPQPAPAPRPPTATVRSLLGLVAHAEVSGGAPAADVHGLGTELLRAFDAGAVLTAGWTISTPRGSPRSRHHSGSRRRPIAGSASPPSLPHRPAHGSSSSRPGSGRRSSLAPRAPSMAPWPRVRGFLHARCGPLTSSALTRSLAPRRGDSTEIGTWRSPTAHGHSSAR